MKAKYLAKITVAATLIHLGASGTSWGDPKIVVLDHTGVIRDVETILEKKGKKREEISWEAEDIKYEGGQANVIIPNGYVSNRSATIRVIKIGIVAPLYYKKCTLPATPITIENDTVLYIWIAKDRNSCEVRDGR
jgi:hypothetical protein